ncbi:MAG: peroxiredoxin [Fidelibacterota bacterium]
MIRIAMVLVFGVALVFGKDPTLRIGDEAPHFMLPGEDGESYSLSDYRGQKVVVYFYPKDDTPGCTKEACNFRDHFAAFEKQNIQVFGISYDSPESHRRFKEKYNLPYRLLSDETKDVTEKYGVAGLLFPKRVTFIVDEEGKIINIYEKVNVTTHGEEILQFLSPPQRDQ